mmetsp:Transcript_21029/g.34779  ORF Transcript_21029/g.34779 Transcript_21029/m.34779 type:complete len:679 (+) Transcript_21029:108-2144(+)
MNDNSSERWDRDESDDFIVNLVTEIVGNRLLEEEGESTFIRGDQQNTAKHVGSRNTRLGKTDISKDGSSNEDGNSSQPQLTDDGVIEYLKTRGLNDLAEQMLHSIRTEDREQPQSGIRKSTKEQAASDAAYSAIHGRDDTTLAPIGEEAASTVRPDIENSSATQQISRVTSTSSNYSIAYSATRRDQTFRVGTLEASTSVELGVGAYAMGDSMDEDDLSSEFGAAINNASTDDEDHTPIRSQRETSVQATKVDDIVQVMAKPLEETRWTPKTIAFLALGIISILAIIIAVTATQVNRPTPDPEPTSSPTISPETRLAVVFDIVANVSDVGPISGIDSFTTPGSPQYKALHWIALEDRHQVHVDETEHIMQRYILAVLFFSTNGMDWKDQFEFMTADNECDWSGALQCNSEGSITDIDLRENGLVGRLPHELSDLSALRSLIFDTNDLTGPLPTVLQELTSLNRLDLWNNDLIGSIPSGYFAMTDLESFKVGRNAISGSIPSEIGLLSKLTVLSLERNLLTGQVPESLWDLTDMRVFDADQQKLSGIVSPNVGKWLNLTHFAFLKLDITGTIPTEMGLLTRLTNLQLAANHMRGTLPTELANLENIFKLSLSFNGFSGTVPREYLKLTTMRELYLQNTWLVDDLQFMCDASEDGVFGPLNPMRVDFSEVNCTCCTCCAY